MLLLNAALQEEIRYLKNTKQRSSYILYEGLLLASSEQESITGEIITVGYYRFKNTQLLNLAPDTGAVFTIEGEKHYGFIQFCDRYGLEVTIEDYTLAKIDRVTVEIESWKLLELQSSRLQKIKSNTIIEKLRNEHLRPSAEKTDFVYGQDNAIAYAKDNPITIIWGPPGTGKTYTLAKIAIAEALDNHRVLILSQSNMAVDSAIIQIRKALKDEELAKQLNNRIFRYGMAKSPDLLRSRYLLSWDSAFDSKPDQKLKYENILRQLENDTNLTIKDIGDLNSSRRSILNEIGKIEMTLIKKAQIVAMTATKATISKNIFDQDWDTVIFDEISMAYISQIMIAASMANKKLVLIGDFKQLAPIVQNDNKDSILRKDIFSYINIVKDNTVRKHPWLIMLNMQWRMHPEIVDFANKHIYEGRLQTAPQSIKDTSSISRKAPFPFSVFSFIDFSGYKSTCFSTRSGSRFNLFSAALTVKIALEAESKGQTDIGIVTPYAAQSQLINAILQDIENEVKKHIPIFCATIHQFQGSERDMIIFDSVESFPKKDTGKIVSSEDDSSMRLVNVALTRTRGKFIIIGNYEYLFQHQSEISKDMLALIKESKSKMHIFGDKIEKLLLSNLANKTMQFFSSNEAALNAFKTDLCKCNQKLDGKFIEYWHAPRNKFLSTNNSYRFSNFIQDSKQAKGSKRIYTSDSGVLDIQRAIMGFPKEKIRDAGIAPKDDFVLIDDTTEQNAYKILWMNMISVYTNISEGRMLPYSFIGNNIVYQFRKLSDLDYGLRLAANKAKMNKASNGTFATYLSSRIKCTTIGCIKSGNIKFQKAKSGKYYVKCADCDQTISQYIPNHIIEDYIDEYDFRCKTCGSKISISKKGLPYCSYDYTHAVGYNIDDIIEKDPPKKDTSTNKQPKVIVIKKKP